MRLEAREFGAEEDRMVVSRSLYFAALVEAEASSIWSNCSLTSAVVGGAMVVLVVGGKKRVQVRRLCIFSGRKHPSKLPIRQPPQCCGLQLFGGLPFFVIHY